MISFTNTSADDGLMSDGARFVGARLTAGAFRSGT
jgi:hypothetical protein